MVAIRIAVSVVALAAADSCYGPQTSSYSLDWAAQGETFFDDFYFEQNSPTMGVANYVDEGTARNLGLVNTGNTTRMKTGGRQDDGRRHSVRVESKKTWKYFLAALKFKHVPFGAGVWPAFWMNGEGRGWPDSGEVDLLEYANVEASKISMHTASSNHCKLHPDAVNKCAPIPDLNRMNYDCVTDYFSDPEHPKLGCGPTHQNAIKTGQDWASSPGVMITEWTPEFVKVFFIPEEEIPADLAGDAPKPETWDKWVVSYFPFAESERLAPGSCPNPAEVLAPQRFIINTELCGDWAGYTWEPEPGMSDFTDWVNKKNLGQCHRFHWRSDDDCCGQFMNSPSADEYLEQRAYWDIEYLKVFTSNADEEVVV